MKVLFTADEVAGVCRVAPRTVWMWIGQGRLGATKVPGEPTTRHYRGYGPMGFSDHTLTLSNNTYLINKAELVRFLDHYHMSALLAEWLLGQEGVSMTEERMLELIERLKLNHAIEIASLHEYRREFPVMKERVLSAEAEVARLRAELDRLRGQEQPLAE